MLCVSMPADTLHIYFILHVNYGIFPPFQFFDHLRGVRIGEGVEGRQHRVRHSKSGGGVYSNVIFAFPIGPPIQLHLCLSLG